jgi:arginyl-tRNA synthetase
VVATVLAAGGDYGRGAPKNERMGRRLQVEFVSANPTGPLHVGHGRGAAYGASLASLLGFAGYEVTREYYVNDAGRQMDILAASAWLRYLELFGEPLPFPPNAYQGGYVREMAEQIKQAHGDRYVHPAEAVLACPVPETDDIEARLDGFILAGKDLLGEDWSYVHSHVLSEQLADCRADLEEFGVHFDVWFSERSLYDTGMVARAVEKLEKAGHIYTQDGAKWFQSTAFGDEKDRVVQRENGIYTYFASDIAYHLNKFERGFDKVIDVWGADHHGYIPRVRGALQASGADAGKLDVTLVQFVSLFRDGQKVSMSTRSGEYVTLRQLREEVGNDACRFFYMLRKCDQALDFDLDLAKSQSNDNPGLLRSVRPCPHLLGAGAVGWRRVDAGHRRSRTSATRARICPVRAAGRVPRVGAGRRARLRAAHAGLLPQGPGRRFPQLVQRRARAGRRRRDAGRAPRLGAGHAPGAEERTCTAGRFATNEHVTGMA